MQSGYAGCMYVYARHVIRARAMYTVCGGENAIEKSRCRHGGGLGRTVRRLQGYPASRAGDQRELFCAGDAGKRIVKGRRSRSRPPRFSQQTK